uniref:single-stranded-DNA-specific exonuclease RecJ n=1 Tax=Agathobacter sp. TaxID=2021311 RepID=UPI0040567C03
MQQWLVINKKADFKKIGECFGIDQVTARIIRNREIVEQEEIRKYLYGGMEDLHNPHLLKDADLLVDILAQKIEEQKPIRIIGDYDIDGVMATYILKTAFDRCKARASIQIPDRIHDGYGLNVHLIQKAYEDGIDTIVTCDNGIAAIEEIAYAKSLGMTVLVTDHHEIPYEETDQERIYKKSAADAIVNPHQKECPYPYKYLCGAAVAWKVVCLLYERFQVDTSECLDLLENAAFATVGDIMPLTGENRILVKEGIKRIRHTKNMGMKALIARCGLEEQQIDAYHFGFVLGPCINASGRLDTAKRALELFFEKNPAKAALIANELAVLNEQRKEMTKEGVKKAIAYCEGNTGNGMLIANDRVLVIYLPEVHESIAGIIAGRIREKYHKPVFVLTRSEGGVKGSGRSIEEYSMYEEMCKCQELFTKFGGHPMAAGLSLPEENVEIFRMKINEVCTLTEKDLQPKIRIDVPMPLDYITKDLVREFSILAPFGKDNTKPVFADRDIRIKYMAVLGKNRNVLKLSLITKKGMPISGIYFGDIDGFLSEAESVYGNCAVEDAMSGRKNPMVLSIVYYPRINTFRDVEELQVEIQEYRMC